MADISVRNIDDVIVAKLDAEAKKHHLSREEYIRRYLSKLTTADEVKNIEEKYAAIVDMLCAHSNAMSEVIERNNILAERILYALENLES